jgi:hypothetical protein
MRRVALAMGVLAGACFGVLTGACQGPDTAAADQVDVHMQLFYWPAGYSPFRDGSNLEVHVTFSRDGTELEWFQVTDGETFACNGSPFELDHSAQYLFLGAMNDGPTLTCPYTRDGATTRFVITEPPRLSLLAPAPNTTIPATQTHVLVRFAPPPTGPQMSLGVGIKYIDTDVGATGATAAPGSTSVLVPLPPERAPGARELLMMEVDMTTQLSVAPSGFHSLAVTFYDQAFVPLMMTG